VVCPTSEFVNRITEILADPRIVYEDVRRVVGEELLRLEPTDPADVARLRALATSALGGTNQASRVSARGRGSTTATRRRRSLVEDIHASPDAKLQCPLRSRRWVC
jgi:hypothetical protein